RHATRPTVPTHAPGPSAPPPCRREPFEIARGRSGTGRDPPGPAAGSPRPARCRDHVRKRLRACENLIAQRTAGRDGAARATARAGRRGSPGPEGGGQCSRHCEEHGTRAGRAARGSGRVALRRGRRRGSRAALGLPRRGHALADGGGLRARTGVVGPQARRDGGGAARGRRRAADRRDVPRPRRRGGHHLVRGRRARRVGGPGHAAGGRPGAVPRAGGPVRRHAGAGALAELAARCRTRPREASLLCGWGGQRSGRVGRGRLALSTGRDENGVERLAEICATRPPGWSGNPELRPRFESVDLLDEPARDVVALLRELGHEVVRRGRTARLPAAGLTLYERDDAGGATDRFTGVSLRPPAAPAGLWSLPRTRTGHARPRPVTGA